MNLYLRELSEEDQETILLWWKHYKGPEYPNTCGLPELWHKYYTVMIDELLNSPSLTVGVFASDGPASTTYGDRLGFFTKEYLHSLPEEKRQLFWITGVHHARNLALALGPEMRV